MAFRYDTDHRDLPNNSDLMEISVADYDFALRYRTDSHDQHTFDENVEVNIDERNTLDQVEVLFGREKYDSVVQTVKEQLEADRKNREELYS